MPRPRPSTGSGGPSRYFVRWTPVLGIFLLLLVGLLAYGLIVPPVQRAHKIERAVRAKHPEFTGVSCRELNLLDATIYSCRANDGPWTSCIHVTGNVDHPIIDVSSRAMYPRGVKPSC